MQKECESCLPLISIYNTYYDCTDTVPGGTFRENLLRTPGQKTMTTDHMGHQFTYDNLKKQAGVVQENGDILINRRDVPEKLEGVKSTITETVKSAVTETVKAVEGLRIGGDEAAKV